MGIAGAGMSALALVARRRGIAVTGCDLDLSDAADAVAAGATVRTGHDPEHVRGARAVVHTAAVCAGHPELEAARNAGLVVVKRAEALGQLVRDRTVVGVAGTHGKTTTTAMAVEALRAAGRHPSGLVGGRVAAWSGNAWLDSDELFVVEADEYDRSFLALRPSVAIVNNVEADHLECYGDYDGLLAAFVEFAERAGRVLINADDPGARAVADRIDAPVWRVGLDAASDCTIGDIVLDADRTRATLALPGSGTSPVVLSLAIPGMHNLRNAAMAVAAVHGLGADPAAGAAVLAGFRGVGRRFEQRGTVAGVTVIDDYAHHPTEVEATLAAARQHYPDRRLVAVFQPHLFSRTARHAGALGQALAEAELVVVTDIYPAREAPQPGVTGQLVADAARAASASEVRWVPDHRDLPDAVSELVRTGDVVIFLGAGSIAGDVAPLLARLSQVGA